MATIAGQRIALRWQFYAFGDDRKVSFVIDKGVNDTAAARQARSEDERQRKAQDAIAADDNVRAMGELFGAEVVADSVRPVADTSSGKPANKK